ncbi:hypothetical protein ACH4C6_14095 [Streptomyces sp. NPDC017943]|uniref:hypothetical protein n=1 Tax=Streptomyces sp. NPDC017943 TaxID=3365019 RepID=UPI0037BCC32A
MTHVTAKAPSHQTDQRESEATRAHLTEQHVDRIIGALDAENAAYLPQVTSECDRLGLTLKLTDATPDGLTHIEVIDGRRTFIAVAGELAVALDDLRGTGRCVTCSNELDSTALVYFDGYKDLLGDPIKICVPCRNGQKVSRALAALAAAKQNVDKDTAECLDALANLIKAEGDPDAVFAWLIPTLTERRGGRS